MALMLLYIYAMRLHCAKVLDQVGLFVFAFKGATFDPPQPQCTNILDRVTSRVEMFGHRFVFIFADVSKVLR